MKKTLLAALLVFALVVPAMAVNLMWDDPNPYEVGVQGYKVYWQLSDGSGTAKVADVQGQGNTHVTINDTNFVYGVSYDYWVTAYNAVGESANSQSISNTRPWPSGDPQVPGAPTGIQFTTQPGLAIPQAAIQDVP